MGADPTRRFMFGLTIDKFNIRLWFFSRSHVFVTEAMNLHTDAKHLIYFALSPFERRSFCSGAQLVYSKFSKFFMTKETLIARSR
ncbi:uncharacterized protein C8R40DRAFT_1080426 [Lentinula edodes]|uniref:uncharacterized protein n=1 Tax=Lentinula edodes TaxID=5353 RepID=UPI001E8D47A2|nr:uncharacterized protein C8R40DRAFT_1080426 [Lentinula edodes]KAH7880497.1 hypothetical protein C8R40DRAFT_1080426 [Lentinula edodes]